MLFNFPSWYLFAIGLWVMFSHWWRLPPFLRSTPKERDSDRTKHMRLRTCYQRTITFHGMVFKPFSKSKRNAEFKMHNTAGAVSHFGLYPFRSPLMGVSLLVSVPPLNNMLKFSGYLLSNSGNKIIVAQMHQPDDCKNTIWTHKSRNLLDHLTRVKGRYDMTQSRQYFPWRKSTNAFRYRLVLKIAHHNNFRGLLRPSSYPEPSYPSLKVLIFELLSLLVVVKEFQERVDKPTRSELQQWMIHPQVHLRIPCYDFFIL